jgi:outer membrane lipoprotein-sorting protein
VIRAALLALALATPAVAQPKPIEPKSRPAAPSAAEQLLIEVEANYKKAQHLSATFDQTVTNSVSGQTLPSNGSFRVEKPNKLRFDYLQPKRKDPKVNTTYLADGKAFYVIDHKNLQYGQKPIESSELPSLMAFFLGAGTLAKDFNVGSATKAETAFVPAGLDGLVLTPKKPSAAYAKLVLATDAKRMVSQITIVNSSGNVQTMKLTRVELDKPAPANTFVLDRASIDGYKQVKP